MRRTDRIDRFQRDHAWLGFPLAVTYKVFDDRGPHLAALVTYYAFVSVFPLLLLFSSAAGFFLESDPQLRHRLVQSALKHFPAVGAQLGNNVKGFRGSGAALAVGIVGTLYGALGAMQSAQAAFNHIYGVPRNRQPNPLKSRVRSLALVALLGTAVLVSTAVAALVSTVGSGSVTQLDFGVRVAGYVVAFVINVALLTAAFQLLTARRLALRDVLAGGAVAGGVWELLQTFGSRYVAHEASHGGSLYGVFGVVLATLAWIYLQSLVLMIAAECNVVRHHRLWPRSLLTPFTDNVELTDADKRAYAMYVNTQRFKGFENVSISYDHPDDAGGGSGGSRTITDREETGSVGI